ncbi:LysR family transcriptional regulator [Fictibacillus sp. Mic-4]|uniref:LysR family transcriptional regulator n=1 Tax=Fictibacillus sp. Mic-4 TaxID=3132826 RepID=UPI003CF3D7D9
MDIRHLKYFESVVRHKNFSKAAEELHVSQPSLSNTIKSLEKELGCKLLERTTREVGLTESGAVFYQHVLGILSQFEHVQKEMKEVKYTGAGTLKIGIIESSKYWIPKIIIKIRTKYPNVHIKIKEMIGMRDIEEALNRHDVHLSIAPQKIEHSHLKFIPIYNEEYVLVTPQNHPFCHLKSINLSGLENENLILSQPGYPSYQKITEACRTAGFDPKSTYEVERLEMACSLAEAGLGVSILPENYLKYSSLSGINILKLTNPTPNRMVYMAYHSNRYLPPVVQDAMSFIIHFFKRDNEA